MDILLWNLNKKTVFSRSIFIVTNAEKNKEWQDKKIHISNVYYLKNNDITDIYIERVYRWFRKIYLQYIKMETI